MNLVLVLVILRLALDPVQLQKHVHCHCRILQKNVIEILLDSSILKFYRAAVETIIGAPPGGCLKSRKSLGRRVLGKEQEGIGAKVGGLGCRWGWLCAGGARRLYGMDLAVKTVGSDGSRFARSLAASREGRTERQQGNCCRQHRHGNDDHRDYGDYTGCS